MGVRGHGRQVSAEKLIRGWGELMLNGLVSVACIVGTPSLIHSAECHTISLPAPLGVSLVAPEPRKH